MITPHPAEAHHVPTRIIPGEVKLLKWDFLRNWSSFCRGPCVEDLIGRPLLIETAQILQRVEDVNSTGLQFEGTCGVWGLQSLSS